MSSAIQLSTAALIIRGNIKRVVFPVQMMTADGDVIIFMASLKVCTLWMKEQQ